MFLEHLDTFYLFINSRWSILSPICTEYISQNPEICPLAAFVINLEFFSICFQNQRVKKP